MKLGAVLVGLFITGMTYAGNGESMIDRLIKRKISYPEALKQKGIEASVQVKLRLLENGKVEVLAIESDSQEMKAEITKQLERISFKNVDQLVGQEFEYKFHFRNEN